MRASGRMLDCVFEFCAILADEISAAVDHHLRREHRLAAKGVGVIPVALGVWRGGKGVFPTELIPIGDAKA